MTSLTHTLLNGTPFLGTVHTAMTLDLDIKYTIKMGHDLRFIDQKPYNNFIRLCQKLLIINARTTETVVSQDAYQKLLTSPLNHGITDEGYSDDLWDGKQLLDKSVMQIFSDKLHPSPFFISHEFLPVLSGKFFQISNVDFCYHIMFPDIKSVADIPLKEKLNQIDMLVSTTFIDFKAYIKDYAMRNDLHVSNIDSIYIADISYMKYDRSNNCLSNDCTYLLVFDPSDNSFPSIENNAGTNYGVTRSQLISKNFISEDDASITLKNKLIKPFQDQINQLPIGQKKFVEYVFVSSITELFEMHPTAQIDDNSESGLIDLLFQIIQLKHIQYNDQAMPESNIWFDFQNIIHQKQNQSLLSLIPAIFDMLVAKL